MAAVTICGQRFSKNRPLCAQVTEDCPRERARREVALDKTLPGRLPAIKYQLISESTRAQGRKGLRKEKEFGLSFRGAACTPLGGLALCRAGEAPDRGPGREGGPGGRALTPRVSPGRTTSTGRGAGRTTWRPSARATRGASRRTRSPFARPSWRRRTRRCARRWPTCARSWASARTSWPSTRPGTGPCRRAAGGRGPDRPSPQRPSFPTSALYQTQQHDGLTFWGVCVCLCSCVVSGVCVCVLPCGQRGVCVCACAPVWSEM